MILSINQPAFLPWLGYFDRINKSDLHVVLDHVQFEKGSFTNRNKILTSNGPIWLTVPVIREKGIKTCINEIRINNATNWKEKHQKSLYQSYSKSNNSKPYLDDIVNMYKNEWLLLNDFLNRTTQYLLDVLSIDTKIVFSSSMGLFKSKSDLVLEICKSTGADTYLSGPLGRNYLELDKFKDADVNVEFHDYKHPEYPQQGEQFLENLSVIDLLFNCGDNAASFFTPREKLEI